jgi:pyridoxal/pyridoxine/pyridoxamine kinase
MITPNQFEAELLSGKPSSGVDSAAEHTSKQSLLPEMKIRCEEDAVAALIRLHKLGPQVGALMVGPALERLTIACLCDRSWC